MDIKTRLTRKPMTTALWVILVTAMALFLSVGCALMYSSGSLAGILDKYHTSIAVRTDKAVTATKEDNGVHYEFESKELLQADIDYLKTLEGVEEVYFHTLTAGYSPSFQPVIDDSAKVHGSNDSYDDVMLIGTVTRMAEPVYYDYYYDLSPIGGPTDAQEYTIRVEVKIEEYIYGNDDYTRWGQMGSDGYVNIKIPMFTGMGDGMIREGGRYLFYGAYDRHSVYISEPSFMEESAHPWIHNLGNMILKNNSLYCSNGLFFESQPDGSYQVVGTGSQTPSIAPIDGTIEEFLAKPENADWVRSIEAQQIAHHSVPVIGTEALETMYAFVNNDANMVQGRSFTREEYDSGAKVCVLSESLAVKSGIGVGDTLTMSQFFCHNGPNEAANWSIDLTDPDGMLNNPNIGEYQPGTPFETQDEEYTVVGIYRLTNEWSDSSYSITPNVVFIPQKAQPEGAFGGMSREVQETEGDFTYTKVEEGGCFGVYFSMKLENGKVEAFELALEESEFAGQFHTIDQGFGKIQESLNSISATAMKLLTLIGGGWLLLLLLYVLLYQAGQRNNLGIMRSLGASPRTVRDYLFRSGMTVAAIGVALGTVLTGAVMNVVQNKLFESTFGTSVSEYSNAVLSEDAIDQMVSGSQLPIWAILAIAAVQLAVFAAVLRLQADKLSKKAPRALMSK